MQRNAGWGAGAEDVGTASHPKIMLNVTYESLLYIHVVQFSTPPSSATSL